MARVILKKDFKDGDKLYGQQLNNNFGTIEAALDAMNKIVWQDDVDESMTAFRGTTEQIQSQPIIDGQLLYDISTGETYIDYNGERISTGSGNSIHIGADTPENDATQIWIDPTEPVTNIGTEVVNNLDGDETYMAPSVHAIKSANTYSTEEVKTGDTWIDGKPIYRKVIIGTTTISSGNYTVAHDISNLGDIVDFKYYSWQNSTTMFIGSTSPLDGSDKLSVYINDNNITVRNSWESIKRVIIIEYTKTTDGSDS